MDIRLRDVSKQFEDTLQRIQTDLKKKTATSTIEQMVNDYFDKKDYLQRVLKRNYELHKQLERYVEREAQMKEAIEEFMKYTNRYNVQVLTEVKKIYSKFTGKAKPKKAGKR